ncbi:TPA: DUF1033 family protein [Streptococcus suis]|nr:DUF1033 family protein [Streptococcus suis]
MYQVIKMYGDFEPWWFVDGWEKDIVSQETFDDFQEAENYFQKECNHFSSKYEKAKQKEDHLVAFWDEDDRYWCEECDEELQRYHSLLLLEVEEPHMKKELRYSGESCPRICRMKQDKPA